MQRIKNFNYYRPRPLIITIVAIYTAIIICKDVYNSKSLTGFNLLFNIGTTIISAATVTMLTFWVYQKWLWKLPFFNKLIDFPHIGGSYYGTLVSTYKQPGTEKLVEKGCVIEIEQQGTDIRIFGYIGSVDGKEESSRSESLSYALINNEPQVSRIVYTYKNTPLKVEDEFAELNAHTGTSELILNKNNPGIIHINYYNRERNSMGCIQLEKMSDTLSGGFYSK